MMNLPTIFNSYKGSVGRVFQIQSHGKRLLGTCFLVANRFVLTCHHVLHDKQGAKIAPLVIQFEGHTESLIEGEAFLTAGKGIDLSILKLSHEVSLPSFPVSPSDSWGESFYTFGYPLKHRGGVTEQGLILGPTSSSDGSPRLELRVDSKRITRGFSGAPVFVVAPEGHAFAIGCISETGSQDYPDVPSCTPLSSFLSRLKHNPEIKFDSFIPTQQIQLEPVLQEITSETDIGSNWKLAERIVNKESLPSHLAPTNQEIANVAKRVFDNVSKTLELAKETDESRVKKLESIIVGLRAKYQELHIDLRLAATRFREIQRMLGIDFPEYPRLIDEARVVAEDVRRVPTHLLSFARNHGAQIHGNVFNEYCFEAVKMVERLSQYQLKLRKKKISATQVYYYENVARLFESAVDLIEFDIGRLSKGYLTSGFVKMFDWSLASRVLAVAHKPTEQPDEPRLLVYAEKDDKAIELIAQLVARKQFLIRKWKEVKRLYSVLDPAQYIILSTGK